ncbi:ABC transporter substrate-binding protein [Bradyrhizobium sp. CCBAU 45389]|uniref:ABC transporter substrate-binding protein n=1 Tax=Bradyrhizobium sp. CCBAU 45389 TaxID=858429 RepID=UPI002304DED1|nr:ABC transporter substrate-binding protein [Bradyrhizobium sp. CCBAU 45389]
MIFLGGLAAILPDATRAQPKQKIYRIGYLSAPSRESVRRILDAFLQKLRELGWIEGTNISIEYRWADGDIARLPQLAAELVQSNVDLIVAPAVSAAVAARNATSRIPIVMVFTVEPVELGLVSSLSRPGGNVTGTTFTAAAGFVGKLLETLKQAVPEVGKVGVLGNSADPAFNSQMGELDAAAASLGIQLQRFDVSGPEQLDALFSALAAQQIDAVVLTSSPTFGPYRNKVAELAIKGRLPMIASHREFSEAGTLLSYGVNMSDFVSRSAVYVDKILRGAQPADLAVEQPTRYELVINLKTAKALGINISPLALARADEVIE